MTKEQIEHYANEARKILVWMDRFVESSPDDPPRENGEFFQIQPEDLLQAIDRKKQGEGSVPWHFNAEWDHEEQQLIIGYK